MDIDINHYTYFIIVPESGARQSQNERTILILTVFGDYTF